MQKFKFSTVIICLFFIGCKVNKSGPVKDKFNSIDTVHRKVILRNQQGDTMSVQQIITFHQVNKQIKQDSFYYQAFDPNETEENYRIYFDRQKVIAYCDSFSKIEGEVPLEYKVFCYNAKNGSTEIAGISDTHFLIEKFPPLIVSMRTGHKPNQYLTIWSKSKESETIERKFISDKGDTLGISFATLWHIMDEQFKPK